MNEFIRTLVQNIESQKYLREQYLHKLNTQSEQNNSLIICIREKTDALPKKIQDQRLPLLQMTQKLYSQ